MPTIYYRDNNYTWCWRCNAMIYRDETGKPAWYKEYMETGYLCYKCKAYSHWCNLKPEYRDYWVSIDTLNSAHPVAEWLGIIKFDSLY